MNTSSACVSDPDPQPRPRAPEPSPADLARWLTEIQDLWTQLQALPGLEYSRRDSPAYLAIEARIRALADQVWADRPR